MRVYEPLPLQYNAVQRPDPQDAWERQTYDLRGLKKAPAKPLDTASYGSQSLAGFTDVLAKPEKKVLKPAKPAIKPAAPAAAAAAAAGPSAGPSSGAPRRASGAAAAAAAEPAAREAGAGSGKAAARPASAGPRPATGGSRPASAGARPPSAGGLSLEGSAAPVSQRGERAARPASGRSAADGADSRDGLSRRMDGPPVAGATRVRAAPPATLFRKLYDRGDLPLRIEHKASFNAVVWRLRDEAGEELPLAQIDDDRFEQYASLFIEGIREKEDPYRFIAVQGMLDLMEHAPTKFGPFLPKLVIPIKVALNTRDRDIMGVALQLLKRLVSLDDGRVGRAFVPFMRQILQIFNLFINRTANLGDGMEYGQQRHRDIGLEIQETLQEFERYGGRDAYAHIKYMIPTYESVESK
eukprot:tig00000624_g2650.t1